MTALALLLGFALGSVPFGLLWHRLRTGGDLRREGSGNIGATNVARTLGLRAGLLVLLLDAGKGAAAVLVVRRLGGGPLAPLAAGVGAVLGHVFSPWLGGRGGKGVATALGVLAVVAPLAAAAALGVFLVVLGWTRTVSVGSLAGAAAAPLVLLASGGGAAPTAAVAAVALLILWRHRENLARLRAGSEPRFAPGRKGTR